MLDDWLGTQALQGIRWVFWGLTIFLVWLAWTRPWRKADRALAVFFVLALSIALQAPTNFKGVSNGNRHEKALAMWKERCQKAGECIHQSGGCGRGVSAQSTAPRRQLQRPIRLSDHCGSDVSGMGVIETFLYKAPRRTRSLTLQCTATATLWRRT